MALQLIGPGSDNDALIAQMNNNISQLQQSQQTQIFKDNTGKARVILGKAPDGTYGLKVSQSGVDVTVATNAQLVFNSSQNVFKIVASGTATITATSGAAGSTAFSNVVSHSLGFTPAYVVFVTPPAGAGTGLEQVPSTYGRYDAGANAFFTRAYTYADVDSTNLTVALITNNAAQYAGDWVFRYYLLQETAN